MAVTQLPESWDPCKIPEVWVWLYQVGTGTFSGEVACQDSKQPSSSLPYDWLFLEEGLGWAQSTVPPMHRGSVHPRSLRTLKIWVTVAMNLPVTAGKG